MRGKKLAHGFHIFASDIMSRRWHFIAPLVDSFNNQPRAIRQRHDAFRNLDMSGTR